jgi:hypothetical protein
LLRWRSTGLKRREQPADYSTVAEPLLVWERPLSAEERRAEREVSAWAIDMAAFKAYRPADPAKREDMLPRYRLPVLPASVPRWERDADV